MTPAALAPPRSREDLALARRLDTLSPTEAEAERIGAAVQARLAASRPSLAREWWGLLAARPLVNVPAALAAAALLLATTPLGALATLAGRLPEVRREATTRVAPSPPGRGALYARVDPKPAGGHDARPPPPRARARDAPLDPRPAGRLQRR